MITEGTPFEVSFEYNPGAEIGISVSSSIFVHVLNDVTAEVDTLVPVYYYGSTLLDSLVRRYFGLMDNGSFYEITSKLSSIQPSNHNNLPNVTGQRRTIETEFNLGVFSQTPELFSYSIDAITNLLLQE